MRLACSAELLRNIASLLGVPVDHLKHSFELTHVFARGMFQTLTCAPPVCLLILPFHSGELVQRNFNLQAALENRDALSRFLYANMFTWIMQEINLSLASDG